MTPKAIRKSILVVSLGLLAAALASAANKEQKRLENAGAVMQEIVNAPENIPQQVTEKAECVIVFPSVLRAAFVAGASYYGRSAMVCRTGKGFKGPWGAPAMYVLEGGSVGFQIGGQATDLVLLVMNDGGVSSTFASKVKLGGDASVAAGPVGRDASADTDAFRRAEILGYWRSRGVLAGVSLEGSMLRPDDDATVDIYGRHLTAKEEGPHQLDFLSRSAAPASRRRRGLGKIFKDQERAFRFDPAARPSKSPRIHRQRAYPPASGSH